MKKGYTHIAILLDRSGSMGSIKQGTIEGYNSFLTDQRKAEGEATITLVQFDDHYEPSYDMLKVADVPDLTDETFKPRGMTALNDSIGKLIVSTGDSLAAMKEEDRPERVLFAIVSDGHENRSTEYTRDQIREMVKHQEEKYSWNFIYIGANQDSAQESTSRGFKKGMSANFVATTAGTKLGFDLMNNATMNYRTRGAVSFEDYKKMPKIVDIQDVVDMVNAQGKQPVNQTPVEDEK